MNDIDVSRAMKASADALTPRGSMPAETLRRVRRARRRVVAISFLSAVAVATASFAAVRSLSPPTERTVASPAACSITLGPVGTIGRSTKRITISAAMADAAFFAGVSPEYDTATANARPRAGRIDASGRIRWFEFDHPEDGFQTRTVTSVAAVSSQQAWFIVDAGGRYVGESALWLVDGNRVTRPAIAGGQPARSASMRVVAAHGGRVWSVGGTAGGGYVAHRADGRWVRVPTDAANLGDVKVLTIDGGGLPWALVQVEDASRYPTGGGIRPGILYLKDALRHFDGARWHDIGLPDGRIATIEGAAAGTLWAVRYQPDLEVLRFANGRWTTVASLRGGKAASSVHLSSDDEGRLFIAEYVAPGPGSGGRGESRLWVLAGSALHRQALPASMTSTMISSISATDDGAVWLVAGATVYRGLCVS